MAALWKVDPTQCESSLYKSERTWSNHQRDKVGSESVSTHTG